MYNFREGVKKKISSVNVRDKYPEVNNFFNECWGKKVKKLRNVSLLKRLLGVNTPKVNNFLNECWGHLPPK